MRSEELRLNSKQEGTYPEDEEQKQETKSHPNAAFSGKRNNFFAVVGMPGSGLLSVAAQVHERVSSEFEPDSLRVLVLDINESNVERNIEQLSKTVRSASRPVVVAIIDSALKQIPVTSVYSKFSEFGCDVACCIAVVCLPGEKSIWNRTVRYLRLYTYIYLSTNVFRQNELFGCRDLVSREQKCYPRWEESAWKLRDIC